MIAAHREEGDAAHEIRESSPSSDNLFNVLMRASKEDQAEKGKGLSDEAIAGKHGHTTAQSGLMNIYLGNAFLFLVAGHEVTFCLLTAYRHLMFLFVSGRLRQTHLRSVLVF